MSGELPPTPLPTYVYKIIPSAPPSPIPEAYPLSDLDRKDGFVHLSTARQVPITSSLFFTEFKSFYILKLRLSNFDPSTIKWDEAPGTNGGCPHLYGNFGAKDVVDSKEFVRQENQTWEDVFRGDRWLE
ncbi:hypothetical protein B0T21DRAFT_412267 [Apiosordaria backusii]|uniref:DUF952 domain-containing protein n=1 Tax=Apiosordaria backusii TaxID=314023 RepID=A0AA40BK19_9PEZI|nr:hypothetical protein B0T21DRAFT_412267 [Apiosordaria backusii]